MSFLAGAGGASGSPSPDEGTPVVVLVRDDDLRLLIRGVLTLYRYPVLLEGTGPDSLRRLGPLERPTVLILDAGEDDRRWREDLGTVLRERPELRALVLFPAGAETSRAEAERLGARVTLVRPVVLRELVRAIKDALGGGSSAGQP